MSGLRVSGISTYLVDGAWVVADDGSWLAGRYASHETAVRAVGFPDRVLSELGRIYRVDGENRPVTDADLDAVATEAGSERTDD